MSDAILVCEAQAIGMIGVIRSLGRAGYRVHAVSMHADALGFQSRYASQAQCHPPYDSDAFIPWLDNYLAHHQIRAVVPSEGFLLAVRNRFERYAPLLPDAPSAEVMYRSFSKCDVQEALQSDADLTSRMPKALVVHRGRRAAPAQVHGFSWPLYVKTDGLHADQGNTSSVRVARNDAELEQRIDAALSTHVRCMVQENVPGVKATVNLWRRGDEILAESMCVAMHENPHTGGLTAYRRVWWHDAMGADARKRLAALGWQGVAMVEYKFDATTGRFWFIELNARYWNALNLDLLSGKDFPRWQLDAFLRRQTSTHLGAGALGYRARYTVPADIGHVMSTLRDPGIGALRKITTALEFVYLAIHPGVHSDLWFPGDRGLYWRGWWRFLSRLGRG